MRCSYNGVEFQQIRLRNLQMFAEKDPTGYDVVMTRIELEISFQWSPFATSSSPLGTRLLAGDGPFPNDSLGLSIRNLRKQLNEPRKLLKISFGADQVWQCPQQLQSVTLRTGGGTSVADVPSCDPGFGPVPSVVSLAEVIGDKLAMGVWRVTFWVLDGSNILLSNRWKVTAVVNDCGLTTRVIEGWTTCRADAIASGRINGIDDFRKWFFVDCPAGFARTGARIQVDETNSKASWICTDVEDPNPLGATGAGIGAVKFEGEITAGVVSANKTKGQEIMGGIEAAFFGPLVLVNQWPTTVANSWIKVTGGKGASKLALTKLGIAIAQDRLFDGSIVACSVTQGVGRSEAAGRWVKVSCVFLPTFTAWVASAGIPLGFDTIQGNVENIVNLKNDIDLGNFIPGQGPTILPGDVPNNETDPRYKNFNLPASNNSRGSWLGALLTQSLQFQGQTPAAPPANQTVTDANLV
jgi:hypothetical protein